MFPVGLEQLGKSAGNSHVLSTGAAEIAAVDPELAQVIANWRNLPLHAKATIMGLAISSLPKSDPLPRRQSTSL